MPETAAGQQYSKISRIHSGKAHCTFKVWISLVIEYGAHDDELTDCVDETNRQTTDDDA